MEEELPDELWWFLCLLEPLWIFELDAESYGVPRSSPRSLRLLEDLVRPPEPFMELRWPRPLKEIKIFFKKWPFFQVKVLKVPDEEDLEPFTAADSATPDDLKREERRVSRLAAEPEAPPPVLDDTPPEAAPKPVEELFPELRLLVLLPQDSWYRVLYIMRPLYLK